MNNKIEKKKIVLKLFTVAFAIMFIVSIILGAKVFAATNPFKIEAATITDKSENVTGNISLIDDDHLNSDVTFYKLNDNVTFKFVLKSSLNKEVKILSITDDNSNENIVYEYDKHENVNVNAESSFDLVVKAVYKNSVDDAASRNQASNVKFTISYSVDDEVNEDTVVINPSTGDNISSSFILLVISSTGLIVCIVLSKKLNNKKVSNLTIIIVMGLILTPIVVKAAAVSYDINLRINIDLYDKYLVTFSDGTTEVTKLVDNGGMIDSFPSFTKTGYSLAKWEKEDGTDFNVEDKIVGDIKLNAVWAVNSYTVTFDSDGGTNVSSITQDYDSSITAPSNPTKEGYTFAGWSPEVPSKMPAENITVKAQWTINSYTITFDSDGGTNVSVIIQDYDSSITAPSNPTKEGYTFAGWNPALPDKMPADNIVLKAQWTINSYTITFDSDGGSTVSPITQDYGTDITLPSDPIKDGFTFMGWSPEVPSKMPAGNMTVIAQWEKSMLCRRATILSREVCQLSGTSTEGCKGDLFEFGETIIYGNIIQSNSLAVGDALDCNVDGTGFNQRFYYLRTINDKAVLISNINFEGDDGQAYHTNYVYDDAPSKLPRTDQWNNLPVTFTHDGDSTVYAARFITMDDLRTVVGTNQLTSTGTFNRPYNFIFENTSYANANDPEYRSTVWIEQEGTKRQRYHKKDRNVDVLSSSNYDTSKNGVRPVIEIPLDLIDFNEHDDESTILFYSLGGSFQHLLRYKKGSVVDDLPVPTRDSYEFVGWYTDTTFEHQFKNGDTINDDTILYAKWFLSAAVYEYNGEGYLTYSSVLNRIYDSNQVTIKLLKDSNETLNIASDRNIIIDLNGHTATNNNDNNVINNKGTAKVINGTIITDASSKAAIENSNNGTLIIDNVDISANGSRSAVYNSKGTVTIQGGSVITSSNDLRPAVMNTSSSTNLYIVDATIISDAVNAIDNNGGTLVIGSSDENINASTPIIVGESYGIVSNANVEMYDGIIKGKIAPVYNGKSTTGSNPVTYSGGTANNSRIIASESGYSLVTGTENDYSTLYLDN